MELIQGSETSANYNLTPGKYPKEHIQCLQIVYKLVIGLKYLACDSVLRIEATRLVNIYQTTRRHTPEEHSINLRNIQYMKAYV